MKKLLTILFSVMVWTGVCAQSSWIGDLTCEELRDSLELPSFYCECERASAFVFPLEKSVKGEEWYTASWDDIKQGLSAYWFSSCSVTMEVYAFCLSKVPTFSLTISGNQMCDMDVEKINQKLANLSEREKEMMKDLKPHIRVIPNKKPGQDGECTGQVYCYPYDQGPEGTCERAIEIRQYMTYVCDKEENVYRLPWSTISSKGKAFIRWKQKENKPAEFCFTLSTCDGDTVAQTELSDSLHVFQPDSAMLVNARKAKQDLWLHVKHAEGFTGRFWYYNNPKYTDEPLPAISGNICEGKTLSANLRTYDKDTMFIDTLWVGHDSLTSMEVQFTFTAPVLRYDTVAVQEQELGGFRYKDTKSGITKVLKMEAFGDTILDFKGANICTQRVQLTVKEKVIPVPTELERVEHEGARAYKQLINGQLFIIIDNRRYTLTGQQTTN